MRPTTNRTPYSRYTFRDQTGYVVAPWIAGVTHEWVAIRHSASVPPWVDADVHLHTDAEEYFFVFQGELQLWIDGSVFTGKSQDAPQQAVGMNGRQMCTVHDSTPGFFTLRPYEALLVRPHVPHSVVGGRGPIEHFVLRIPAHDDRETVGKVPDTVPSPTGEDERALRLDWGCRVPLTRTHFQNCWLFGVGQARFHSDQICLAYLDLPTEESADADWRSHPHRLHAHRESWEYYTVLKGKKTLRINDELVEIKAGEILEVSPGVKHVARTIETPYQGFTFRAPRREDKVVLSDGRESGTFLASPSSYTWKREQFELDTSEIKGY